MAQRAGVFSSVGARLSGFSLSPLFALFAACGLLGCASHGAKGAKGATAQEAPIVDADACSHICTASTKCGDSQDACQAKCSDWLIARSRPGIAAATARCAVPRIDDVCAAESAGPRRAATALVSCIDEAGRDAIAEDNSSLLVAAMAICRRGARCNDRSEEDADNCVAKISHKIPRGLGIFGAIKPELVSQFADCMEESECGPEGDSESCFGEMLGEEPDSSATPSGEPEEPSPVEEPEGPGTKI